MRSKRFASLLVALVVVGAVLAGISRVGHADARGKVAFSAATYAVVEGPGVTVTITVNFALQGSHDDAFVLGWKTVEGAGQGTATPGSDYTAASGTLSWTHPSASSSRTFTVTILDDSDVEGLETVNLALTSLPTWVTLLDPSDGAAAIEITDDDTPTNSPPVYTGASTNMAQTVAEGAGLAAVAATDPDADPLTYSLQGGSLPAGITLQSDGSFTGTVDYAAFENGPVYTATIRVSDPGALFADTALVVTVTDTNRAPVYTGAPTNTAQTVAEGAGLTTAVAATDPDLDTLTYSLQSGALPAGITLQSDGSFTGTVGYSAFQSGPVYNVTIRVSDGALFADTALAITVTDTNRTPVFGSLSRTINENATPAPLTATDADSDSLTFSLASGETLPDGLSLNAGGTFSGPASYSSSGDWDIDVEVTDGTDTTSGTLHLVIHTVNQAPVFGHERDGDDYDYAENEPIFLACAATDPDSGDTLAYSLTAGPGWLSINDTTGAVTGTAPWNAAEIAGGVYTVTVRCTDGTAPITETFTLNITNVNRAPNFTAVATNTAQYIGEGSGLAALAATDPDSDTLTFTRTGGSLPPGITLQSGGTFSGTANHGSTYSVTIRVSDGSLTATTVLRVTVAAEEEDEAPAPPRVGPPLKTGIVITVVPGSHVVWVNGYPRDLDAPAYYGTPGRMMVPLRFVSETVGAEVLWNPVAQKITIRGDWTTIVLTVGSRTAFVNGVAVRLDAPAVLLNGRVFVPLRFICEALGAQVDYRPSTHSARIQR